MVYDDYDCELVAMKIISDKKILLVRSFRDSGLSMSEVAKRVGGLTPSFVWKVWHGKSFTAMERLVQHFWKYVAKKTIEECWFWIGTLSKAGYGRILINGKHYFAHRLSFLLSGRDPNGLVIRHICDNPHCVNPAPHWGHKSR